MISPNTNTNAAPTETLVLAQNAAKQQLCFLKGSSAKYEEKFDCLSV
jgi:hypothetical protein